MTLDPGYSNLWIPFIFVCVLALLVITVLGVMVVQILGGMLDEIKRFNGNDEKERLYFQNITPPPDPPEEDGDNWKIGDLYDKRCE